MFDFSKPYNRRKEFVKCNECGAISLREDCNSYNMSLEDYYGVSHLFPKRYSGSISFITCPHCGSEDTVDEIFNCYECNDCHNYFEEEYTYWLGRGNYYCLDCFLKHINNPKQILLGCLSKYYPEFLDTYLVNKDKDIKELLSLFKSLDEDDEFIYVFNDYVTELSKEVNTYDK